MSTRLPAQVKPATVASGVPARSGVLQRKCACGGTPGPAGACAACQRQHELGGALQTKLRVNQPGDRYEREADRVAAQVMRATEPRLQRQVDPEEEEEELLPTKALLQQRAAGNVGTQTEVSPIVHQVLRSPGRSLDPATRAYFEPRLGHDFSRVRVHADTRAAEAAHAVRAQAFTLGRHIVFGAGHYTPRCAAGQKLLAHELTHVVQQGAARPSSVPQTSPGLPRTQTQRTRHVPRLRPGATSIRLLRPGGGERLLRPPYFPQDMGVSAGTAPPVASTAEAQAGSQPVPVRPEEKLDIPIQRMPLRAGRGLLIQRTATFTNPTPQAQDPLARLANGNPPGLTTPTINGNVVSTVQNVLTAITPTQVQQTGSAGGNVNCRFAPSFNIDTSANVIVATNAAARGWTGNFPSAQLGNPAACAARRQIPTTMVARPSNANFVTRVRASEQEHVDEIRTLHSRHFVPYDRFITGLRRTGPNLNACAQSLAGQLANRHTQAAFGFTLGYAAATEKLDGPQGTHADMATPAIAANCASLTLTVSQRTAPIAGAAPGNVVTVAPTVTTFNPNRLSASSNNLVETTAAGGTRTIKTFSSNANARRALQVIRHYRMTTRNVIGAMEYFLAAGRAPSGTLAGVNELTIHPDLYQVTLGVPAASNWAITEVMGNNIVTLVNFTTHRNEAYSAWDVLQSFRFTRLCWVGGTRQAPEMLYFRT